MFVTTSQCLEDSEVDSPTWAPKFGLFEKKPVGLSWTSEMTGTTKATSPL